MAFEFLNERQTGQVEYLRTLYLSEEDKRERKKYRFGITAYLAGLQDSGAIDKDQYRKLYDYCLLA